MFGTVINNIEEAKEAFRILPVPIHMISRDMEIWRNAASKEVFSSKTLGSNICYEVLCGRTSICENCQVLEVFHYGVPRRKQRQYEKKIFDVKIVPYFNGRGVIMAVIEILIDITAQVVRQEKVEATNKELEETNEKLEMLSITDPLTRSLNRRGVFLALEEEISRAYRFGEKFSIILFDLDNFKSINDANGHAAGDKVLRDIVKLAKKNLRAVDKIGRYGGDEFLITLPETSIKGAKKLADKLKRLVANHKFLIDKEGKKISLKTTISAGGAEYAKEEKEDYNLKNMAQTAIETMLHVADNELYKEKTK